MEPALQYIFGMRSQNITSRTKIDRTPSPETPLGPQTPQIFDKDLTCYRDGIRWSFSGGKILLDGQELNRLMTHNPADMGFYMGVAEGLYDYRKKVVASARNSDQFAKFEAIIEALLGKILGQLKKFYDQKISGLSWTLQNGQLILNGINIRSFLALYRIRKTDKARKFLKGLRGKLVVLLENKRESPDYERIREVVQEVYHEMDIELAADQDHETSRTSRRLLSHGSCAS
jgi:hypothetical protein